jgi:trigger factor
VDVHVDREDLGSRRIKLTITVPQERIDTERERVARELSRRHKVPGFRPGKVPYERMLAIVGAEAIDEEAIPAAARRVIEAAIIAEGIVPSATVRTVVVGESPLRIEATVPLQPDVDLGDYRSLRLPAPPPPEIDDAEVEAMIDRWREERAFLAPVDRPAAEGDVVSLSLIGRLRDSIVFDDDTSTTTA